jgi:hypothetical protein
MALFLIKMTGLNDVSHLNHQPFGVMFRPER